MDEHLTCLRTLIHFVTSRVKPSILDALLFEFLKLPSYKSEQRHKESKVINGLLLGDILLDRGQSTSPRATIAQLFKLLPFAGRWNSQWQRNKRMTLLIRLSDQWNGERKRICDEEILREPMKKTCTGGDRSVSGLTRTCVLHARQLFYCPHVSDF